MRTNVIADGNAFTKVFLTSLMRTENYHLQCGRVVRKTDQIINILWHW